MRFAQKVLVAACAAALVGCSVGSNSPPAPAKVMLSAMPPTYTFPLDNPEPPLPITVTRSAGSFSSLTLSVGNPTLYGVTPPRLTGNKATFSIIPIASESNSTLVTATDQADASTSVSVSTTVCTRPPSLLAAQQVIPASGATGVSPSTETMYFVAYFSTGVGLSGNLHFAVGAHGTLEGGPLVAATLPPGTVLPTPIPLPDATDVIVSVNTPELTAGQTYQTQLYNDFCQAPVVAGTFST
jgi:hypothetical protein